MDSLYSSTLSRYVMKYVFFPIQSISISVGSKHLALPPSICHPTPLHEDHRPSILLVAQAQGHLPVNGEQLYVGLVLAAILLRLVTNYLVKVRLRSRSRTKYLCAGLGPIPRLGEPHL